MLCGKSNLTRLALPGSQAFYSVPPAPGRGTVRLCGESKRKGCSKRDEKTHIRFLSLILALMMIFSSMATTALAAEQGRKWFVLTGGDNNGNGHNYGNGASAGPLFYLDADRRMVSGGTVSLALKPSNNWGVFYSYINDQNWLYVGYDSSSQWYYQYRWNGQESYPGITGLPEPVEGEELSLSISLSNETLAVTVNGKTAYATNPAVITVDLGTTLTIGGFKFHQRPGTNNGIVYRYSYRILDDQGNVLASGSDISIADVNRSGGAWIVQKLEENVEAAKIEISILEGQGGFAAIAEIAPISVTKLGG